MWTSAGLDMVGKMLANKGSEVNNRKAEQEIQNLKKTNEQITENIGKIKEDKKTGIVTGKQAEKRSDNVIQ